MIILLKGQLIGEEKYNVVVELRKNGNKTVTTHVWKLDSQSHHVTHLYLAAAGLDW